MQALENANMSLAEDMDPGARLEAWRCCVSPRTCRLLGGQTARVMSRQPLCVDSGRGTSCSCVQPLRTNLQSMFFFFFACQILGLFKFFFCVFSPDSFLSKQSRKIRKLKIILFKGVIDSLSPAGVLFWGQMLENKS